MKTVWILNHYAVPPGAPGGTRHFSLARHLATYGWQAIILASSVEHLSGKQRLPPEEQFRSETIDGVQFLWLRTSDYRGNGGARVRNMLDYAFRAWFPASTRLLPKPDVIIGSSVHPFAAAAGSLLAKRYKVPFVFEVRDLWPQTLIDLGRIRSSGAIARGMRLVERWLYRRAARIVTLLPRAVDYIAPLGVADEKVVWIPNGVELSDFPDPGPPVPIEGRHFTLMYFGAHGTANALSTVLRAMKLLQSRDEAARVRLRMIGDGPAKSDLETLAHSLGLENVSFEPAISKSVIPATATQADAFVLSVLDRPSLYRYGISMNKIYDFLAARRPIIMASGAVNDPVGDAGAGWTVLPEDPVRLADALAELMATPAEVRDRMGKAGRRYVEEFGDFKILAGKLAAVLDDCVRYNKAK